MDTLTTLKIYEINGKETKPLSEDKLNVSNAGNNNFVKLFVGGNVYTVNARELHKAIENAQNQP